MAGNQSEWPLWGVVYGAIFVQVNPTPKLCRLFGYMLWVKRLKPPQLDSVFNLQFSE